MRRPTPYWHDAIRIARENGSFTKEDRIKANSWVDCACGKQDPRIQRFSPAHDDVGAPLDSELREYGFEFGDAVNLDDFNNAARLIILIEKRAAEIIAGLQ